MDKVKLRGHKVRDDKEVKKDMDAKEYLNSLQKRFSTYTHLRTLLTSTVTKEEFDTIVNDVLDNIQEDTSSYSEFSRTYTIPAVDRCYMDLQRYSGELVEYLYYFKKLKEF